MQKVARITRSCQKVAEQLLESPRRGPSCTAIEAAKGQIQVSHNINIHLNIKEDKRPTLLPGSVLLLPSC